MVSDVARDLPDFTTAAIIKKVFACHLKAFLQAWTDSESTPEPTPVCEPSEYSPESAPVCEFSESTHGLNPVREPS